MTDAQNICAHEFSSEGIADQREAGGLGRLVRISPLACSAWRPKTVEMAV